MAGVSEKMCDLCHKHSDNGRDQLLFGDWMHSHDITVHYFCLLLSTHLPQRGKDDAGILGFQMRDIRTEIRAASNRRCCFCTKSYASIRCCQCKEYFHLMCGRRNFCQFEFCDEFRSYCRSCAPLDDLQLQWQKGPPPCESRCFICQDPMGLYNAAKWIHGSCCGFGFVHSLCMQEYALSAGYYLRCLWCGDTKFRDHARLHGIFVPDRDAQWERQKNAFKDLHEGHNRCDMPVCNSPRGRDYVTPKWSIILCALCGSVGAHNPHCVPGREKSDTKMDIFKCDTCSAIECVNEKHIREQHDVSPGKHDNNTTLFMHKLTRLLSQNVYAPTSSEEESVSSSSSVITVVAKNSRAPQSESQTESTSESEMDSEPFYATHSPNAPLDRPSVRTKPSTPDIIDLCTSFSEIGTSDYDIDSEQQQEATENVAGETKSEQCDQMLSTTPSTPADPGQFDHIMQSAIVSSTTPPFSTQHFNFDTRLAECTEMFEFDENLNCLGRCAVRLDAADPRFNDIALLDAESLAGLITEQDVVQRFADVGVFAAIDAIIAEENIIWEVTKGGRRTP